MVTTKKTDTHTNDFESKWMREKELKLIECGKSEFITSRKF